MQGTDYLDAVYLHDVEYVAEDQGGFTKGGHCTVPSSLDHHTAPPLDPAPKVEEYGQSYGPGDETIILAVKTLFQLKQEGLIRCVGISGKMQVSLNQVFPQKEKFQDQCYVLFFLKKKQVTRLERC
jgi:aryl-alcohol dehydrogenase-like predicted oxidoreductase